MLLAGLGGAARPPRAGCAYAPARRGAPAGGREKQLKPNLPQPLPYPTLPYPKLNGWLFPLSGA